MPLDVDVPVCILQELSPSVKAAVTFFSQVAAYAASLLYGGDLFAYLSNSQTVWRGRRTPGHDLEGANAARWFDPSADIQRFLDGQEQLIKRHAVSMRLARRLMRR